MVVKSYNVLFLSLSLSISLFNIPLPVLILLNERLVRPDARFNAQTKCIVSNSVYDIIEAAVSGTYDRILLEHTKPLDIHSQIFHINPRRKSARKNF